MSKIEKLSKTKTIDNSQREIHFIERIQKGKISDCIDKLKEKISSATETICIASTSEIDLSIKDEILQKIKDRVRVYGLFRNFQNSSKTIAWFDKNNPVLCRSNRNLDNNFIIIDNQVAFLFINPLDKLQNNPCIILKKDECRDLFYWFTHYFWNTDESEKERLIEKVDARRDAPISVPAIHRNFVNLETTLEETFKAKASYFPCSVNSKKAMELSLSSDNLVSEDLAVTISHDDSLWKIGNLVLDYKAFLGPQNVWKDSRAPLGELPKSFIDYDSGDWKILEKQSSVEKTIPTPITAVSIEAMVSTEPIEKDIVPDPYAEKTIFKFEVLPPSKPKDAKKAAIYKQFDDATSNITTKLSRLKEALNNLLQKEETKGNKGLTHSINDMLDEIKEDEKTEIKSLRLGDLTDFIEKWTIQEDGYWVKKLIDLRTDVIKERFELEKKSNIKNIETDINNIENEISTLNNKKISIDNEVEKIRSNIENLQTAESSTANNVEENKKNKDEIKNLNKQLISKKNELTQTTNTLDVQNRKLQKKKESLEEEQKKEFKTPSLDNMMKDIRKDFSPAITKPDYVLPEVGELFENKQSFFLEIEDDRDLAQANELQNRYNSKDYKVVAKV